MAISAVSLLWLTDPHDLHGIPTPDWEARPVPTETYFLHVEFTADNLPHNRVNTCFHNRMNT